MQRMVIDQVVVDRYRRIYGLGEEVGPEQVRQHWLLETALTANLLQSTPENRWQVFSDAYTKLYKELPWLNKQEKETEASLRVFRRWNSLLTPQGKVLEIGSGKAGLLKYLVSAGHLCVATEITKERGSKHLSEMGGLAWHITDGIHLAEFEPSNCYDVVISTQVIEHFHPDDVEIHFRNAWQILKPGGRYIFDTPHVGTGPGDLSQVFDLPRAVCMHLKEYNYIELGEMLRRAGFHSIRAVFDKRFLSRPRESALFFAYCCLWDLIERRLRLDGTPRRWYRALLRWLFVPSNIWLSATK